MCFIFCGKITYNIFDLSHLSRHKQVCTYKFKEALIFYTVTKSILVHLAVKYRIEISE